jgi:hypothetical protein
VEIHLCFPMRLRDVIRNEAQGQIYICLMLQKIKAETARLFVVCQKVRLVSVPAAFTSAIVRAPACTAGSTPTAFLSFSLLFFYFTIYRTVIRSRRPGRKWFVCYNFLIKDYPKICAVPCDFSYIMMVGQICCEARGTNEHENEWTSGFVAKRLFQALPRIESLFPL